MTTLETNFLNAPLLETAGFKTILEGKAKSRTPILCSGVLDTQKIHLIAGAKEMLQHPVLIITYSELKAKEIFEDLQFFLEKEEKPLLYPAKDIIFYAADVKSATIVKQRFDVLNALITGEQPVIVLSVDALFDRLAPKAMFEKSILEYSPGDEISIEELSRRLVFMGYERTGLVEGPGQFAVRGGIVDLFTTIYDNALRFEFWGDEIDSIRLLDSSSQRSIEKLDHIRIFPMRELVYGDAELKRAIDLIEKECAKTLVSYEKKGLYEEGAKLRQEVVELCQRLKTDKSAPGVDRFIQFFYEESATLFDYLPEDTFVYFDEPPRIRQKADNAYEEFNESIKNRILKGYMLPSQMNMVYSYGEILHAAGRFSQILLTSLIASMKDFTVKESATFNVKGAGTFKNRVDLLVEDLQFLIKQNYRIAVLAGTRAKGEKLLSSLVDQKIPASYIPDIRKAQLVPGIVSIASGSIHKGFEYEDIRLAVISDKELFGSEKQRRKFRKHKTGAKIENFTDLRLGDYVVHDNHGIGVYEGIENIITDNIRRDYLKLAYANGGTLYVPTSQMDMITKYIGKDAAKPKISKLGGGDWTKAKSRAKGAVEILAKDLIALYAARQEAKGFQFNKDSLWQKEFEDMFPFEETEDQLAAIEDVKQDMESTKVMDRLICGDVGYGKTEVAIRAAFKAVQDGKQVAYLVPTTILAQQHYNTFLQRMQEFPVNIEMMSRFRTAKQLKETVENLAAGKTDVIIGTHRILSKDLKFKDLGLIIVDEEQRFGVGHKEKLKKLKENVDVLTLTATPIPRTLHMSLTGIRDMSILDEPPQERQPIQTYVMEYNPEFVKDAIHRELARGGQVYYLYNRVSSISEIANRIQNLVPEANVNYAHGQMNETELENIMMEFVDGNVNVLVCTTIIETGLDIANVNTIIIHDADNMGLAQLYQLRGRVGRSNRIAYCYLMYRKDKVLKEHAEKRLQTIREFTEFGSGFKIAMRDLEIRGAGNLLGEQQHGHMDTVGYDMYCRLLDEAVKDLKGEEVAADFETSIDVNISAFIPSSYIENEEQKLEIYKKISHISNSQDYFDVQEEIEDRYGDLPVSVQNLLEISLLKGTAHRIGVTAISQKGSNLVVVFKNDANVDPDDIGKLVMAHKEELMFTVAPNPYLTYKTSAEEITGKILDSLREMLATLGEVTLV